MHCCRAVVSEREPVVAEREPSAAAIVAKHEPETGAVVEPVAFRWRATTPTPDIGAHLFARERLITGKANNQTIGRYDFQLAHRAGGN